MITIRNLSKRFGKLTALQDINLDMQKGECIALIGPNGCGKTTLIKSILGMVLPDTGEIRFAGKSIRHDNEYRAHIGFMPQIGRYPENMTVGQVIDMIKGIRQDQPATDADLYTQFGIKNILHKKMRTLSGGTTQKVSATLAFLFQPPVLILDEPTAGLDPIAASILKEKIRDANEQGTLVLITSHMLSDLEDMVTQVIFMQEGQLLLHQDVNTLKQQTGQNTITRSIIHLLKADIK